MLLTFPFFYQSANVIKPCLDLFYGSNCFLLQNFIRAFKAACNHDGHAMLVIPEGNFVVGSILLSGPCTFQPPLMVQFAGNILPQGSSVAAEGADWITFQNFNGLILSGKGTINGQGEKVWKPECDSCPRMPAVSFRIISHILLFRV